MGAGLELREGGSALGGPLVPPLGLCNLPGPLLALLLEDGCLLPEAPDWLLEGAKGESEGPAAMRG